MGKQLRGIIVWGDEIYRRKERETGPVGGTFLGFSYGGQFWLLLQQLAAMVRPSDLFWRDIWMDEWFPSSCRPTFPPGLLLTTLQDPELDTLGILLPQMLGQSPYSGLIPRRAKALGTQLFWINCATKGWRPGRWMPPVVKSESRANSLLTLRALGWGGGGRGGGNQTHCLLKSKGKSNLSEAGWGNAWKKPINTTRLPGGSWSYVAFRGLKDAEEENNINHRIGSTHCSGFVGHYLKWPEGSSGECLIELLYMCIAVC